MNLICIVFGHSWQQVVDKIGTRPLPDLPENAIGFESYAVEWHDECSRCGARTPSTSGVDTSP